MMPKYIDAEALRAAVTAYHDSLKPRSISRLTDAVIHDVLDIIDKAPAADVAQVVRCKDCVNKGECATEETFNFCRMSDGFCRVGKRRSDDERH